MIKELEAIKSKLIDLQNNCNHQWADYKLDCTMANVIKADGSKEGTVKKVACLSRECTRCGKKEYLFGQRKATIPTRSR